ncbi:hypothetical protein CA54_05880 [Symmachiella macrocystis]|uniref:Transglycosylase associated protein n=1 Tax=Symmachiella macrocystis TaxID=2527985 RepID=A0A5C6BI88_9PLAN|nr:GlsB/YeaQ/YmgE family stress response membrane protein [Symmachiella macrocystis]TWU11778.1 hypothetical protein CA54_05880 [Symmachiella macrocystis]
MKFELAQIVVWLIVGALAGSLAGMLVTFKKEGLGRWTNLGVGLAGALIGGGLFKVLNINLALGELNVSFQDLVSAFAGSMVLIIIWWIVGKTRRRKSHSNEHDSSHP